MAWTTSINQHLLPGWGVALMGLAIFVAICLPICLIYFGQRPVTLARRVEDSDHVEGDETSLDVLRREDLLLRELFAHMREDHGMLMSADDDDRADNVLRRYEYGDRARQALRHLAVHQSAATDVASGVSGVPALRPVAAQIDGRATASRPLINELRALSRRVDLASLNEGQDFDDRFSELMDTTSDTIEFELDDAVPAIEQALDPAQRRELLRSAHYVQRHAPTKLNPTGPRRYETAPVVSRALTVWDHLVES